ncbi:MULTISPECIES: DsbA family protein [unclassified Amycolatopsis]|uniref:DsbA family protein n=1 Tax=unclassified Amycolatopsis TaxID=2618356 RepID=UPI002E15BFF7|nr:MULTISPECIES: thioredoxin domain-containing protein [unclassified Amycolatopsis]WSK77468.1 DsbA family protein [Amycolatopsis sp. NBC_01286]
MDATTSVRSRRRKANLIFVGVLVLAVVAGALVWLFRTPQEVHAQSVSASYPAVRQDAVVTAGKDSAPVTIDVYEDFLCPHCAEFEKKYSERIRTELDAGRLKVRYHELPMLQRKPNSDRYSLRAANAALCAADQGGFVSYHETLMHNQPPEAAPVFDDPKLIAIGHDLGITAPEFAACVTGQTHFAEVEAAFEQVKAEPAFQVDRPDGNGRAFRGTPTIAVGTRVLDTDDERWLASLGVVS